MFAKMFCFYVLRQRKIIIIIELEVMLTKKLYGQQIAHETILTALRAHLKSDNSPKALVMSFHGTPGTGKNYVTHMIATAFYKKGVESQYFHFFNGRNDFPLERKIDEYKVYILLLVLFHQIHYNVKLYYI